MYSRKPRVKDFENERRKLKKREKIGAVGYLRPLLLNALSGRKMAREKGRRGDYRGTMWYERGKEKGRKFDPVAYLDT